MSELKSNPSGDGAVRRSVRHLSIINENDGWETPKVMLWDFFQKIKIFPRLDVCTTKEIARRQRFAKFFTKEQDALKQQWDEDFFMNCPYSEAPEWIAYAYEQAYKHEVNGIILSFSKTDTKWWHQFVENNKQCEVHFIKGRVKFHVDGKESENSAPYPSCWIIFKGRMR